jgi:hypothetical protein
MTFSEALEYLKQGRKVKRAHWGGYWFIPLFCQGFVDGQEKKKTGNYSFTFNKIIVACLKDNGGYVPATPYQEDLMADDWELVD